MKILKLCLCLSAVALFIFACAENKMTNTTNSGATKTNTNSAANTPSNAQVNETADARKTYNQFCANCHKEDGTGGKKEIEGKTINAENLTTEKMKKMADDKIADYIKNGVPDEGMPAFKNRLTDEQINELIKFIRTELQKQ